MSDQPPLHPDSRSVVAGAIQGLVATRLGRGFVPLAGLFGAGIVGAFGAEPAGWWTAAGALATAACMLTYGLMVVRRTLGRSGRWSGSAMILGLVPPLYGLYVLAWRGLRGLTEASGAPGWFAAILYVVLGVWVLRSWLRVVEIRRLARIMASNIDEDGESG